MSTNFTTIEINQIQNAALIAQEYFLERAQEFMPSGAAKSFRPEVLQLYKPAGDLENKNMAAGTALFATVSALNGIRRTLAKRLSSEPIGELRMYKNPELMPKGPDDDDYCCSIDEPTETGRALLSAIMRGYVAASNDVNESVINALNKMVRA